MDSVPIPRIQAFAWGICTASMMSLGTLLSAKDVDFNRDIRPILSNKCFACHGPDSVRARRSSAWMSKKTQRRIAKVMLQSWREALIKANLCVALPRRRTMNECRPLIVAKSSKPKKLGY